MNQTSQQDSVECIRDPNQIVLLGENDSSSAFDDSASLSRAPPLVSCDSFGNIIEDHITPDYVPGSFEGPEKTLEVCFRPGVVVH